ILVAAILAFPAAWLTFFGAGALRRGDIQGDTFEEEDGIDDEAEEDEDEGGFVAFGIVAHWWLSARAFLRRNFARPQDDDPLDALPAKRREHDDFDMPAAARGRVEPGFDDDFSDGFDIDDDEEDFDPQPAQPGPAPSARVENPAPRPAQGSRVRR